jgi:aminoglycoside 6-adenylyltransferase
MDQKKALEEIVAWADADDNVRMVVLTGSVARDEDVDELSDLDIELYVRDPAELLNDRTWYGRFGDVLAVEELENPGWNPTRLVHYLDAEIDFMVAGLQALDAGVQYDRTYRVLLDKDGLGDRLAAGMTDVGPPTAEEFRRCVNWFTAAALLQAKDIARDEPWMAKMRDRDLKDQLLEIIEWDHRARYGWHFDTWHLGVHMRRWMDADVQDALDRCWASFSLADERTALLASIELFDRLCRRTADALGFEAFDRSRIEPEVERILRRRALQHPTP